MKKTFVLFALVIFLGFAMLANAQNPNTMVAKPESSGRLIGTTTPTATIPEFTGTFYIWGSNGALTALPRASVKVGGSLSVVIPSAPTLDGSLVVKIEGTSDPASLIRMARVEKGKIPMGLGDMSTFKRPVDVSIKNLGDRVFEVTPKTTADGDYVVTLKSGDPFATPELFVFRVEGKK
jgi:hypothetical protein